MKLAEEAKMEGLVVVAQGRYSLATMAGGTDSEIWEANAVVARGEGAQMAANEAA